MAIISGSSIINVVSPTVEYGSANNTNQCAFNIPKTVCCNKNQAVSLSTVVFSI